jgi:integrase
MIWIVTWKRITEDLMTIRKEEDLTYTVWHSQRHPISRKPKMLRRVGIKSLAEAKRVEKELIIKIHKKFEKTISPSWKEVVDEFIMFSKEKELSPRTVDNRKLCLNAYTMGAWKDKSVKNINGSDIRDIIHMKTEGKSPSQKKNVLKYIRLCFEYALEKGYVDRNPTPQMKFKVGDKVKKVLTGTQLGKLLSHAKLMNIEWYPHWAMAIYTGMRNGELYALSWDKVNLEERQIVVDCAWDKKGGLKSTKSGDERIVEIAPPLIPILKELKIKFGSESVYVLPRIDKWDKGEQARELRLFLAGLNLPQIRFHDLRASWATIMLSKGVPAIKVMRMGGWKEMKTMQHYMRMAGVDIKGITNELLLHNPYERDASILSFNK